MYNNEIREAFGYPRRMMMSAGGYRVLPAGNQPWHSERLLIYLFAASAGGQRSTLEGMRMHRSYAICRWACLVWLLCASVLPLLAASPAHHTDTVSLMLNGVPCGVITSFSGGAIVAEIPGANAQPGQITPKALGQISYEAITVSLRLPVAPAVHAWIADTWAMKAPRKSGSIIFTAASGQATALLFTDALLTEVAFAPFDSTVKNVGQVTLTFQPATITEGGTVAAPTPASQTAQQSWLCANFRLALDGMNCADVTRIEGCAARQGVEEAKTGIDRYITPAPGKLTFANLRLTLPDEQAAAWRQWMQMLRTDRDVQEKQGYISLLSADQQTEIQRITLSNVGICRVARAPYGPDQQPTSVIVDLYCEQMTFNDANTPPQDVQPEGPQVPNGKGKLGTTYIMRQGDPLHFTLESMRYSVEPVTIGDRCVAATADSKLLVLNFTVGNPHVAERLVRGDVLRLSAVGIGDVNYPAEGMWGIGATGREAALNLPGGGKLTLYAIVILPAKREPETILVKSNKDNDGPLLAYDVHGHVPALPAPFADPRDTTGASVLEEVPAKTGTAYPALNFTITVEKMGTTPAPLGEVKPGAGERLFVCEVRMRNHTLREQLLRWDILSPILTTEGGEKLPYKGMLLVTSDRPVSQPIEAGDEIHVRLVFLVPKDAQPFQLVLREGKSRRYRYLLQ